MILVLLVPALLMTAWDYSRVEANEERLAAAAAALVEKDVEVGCPGFWRRLLDFQYHPGQVRRGELKTSLSARTCSSLESLWRGGETPSFDCLLAAEECSPSTLHIVRSLTTLAHESWHMRGVYVEAETECYAVQTVEFLARRMGIPPRDAQAIAWHVANEDAARGGGEYHSQECRPGGDYDLHPQTPDWPTA